MADVGYIRVSTVDQNTDRQLDGIEREKTFTDKVSGATTKRPQLQACLEYLREGDTLHVHSIDRLARNLEDLQATVRVLTGRGVAVRFHKEGLTFSGQDDPMARLMFQMMGAFAEFERALIRERQREGIAKAKAEGKHLGRERKLSAKLEAEIKAKAEAGAEKKALAAEYGISRQTLYRALAR
jgi:DNA invertase Pin-like site-specific DNA recombinase